MHIQLAIIIVRLFIHTARPCTASWYGPDWDGNLTASGTVYDCTELTCAHKTFPLGSIIRFWNPDTGIWLDCWLTDRGPYVNGRDYDLTTTAFDSLSGGDLDKGIIDLRYRIIGRDIQGLSYNLDLPDESASERERLQW